MIDEIARLELELFAPSLPDRLYYLARYTAPVRGKSGIYVLSDSWPEPGVAKFPIFTNMRLAEEHLRLFSPYAYLGVNGASRDEMRQLLAKIKLPRFVAVDPPANAHEPYPILPASILRDWTTGENPN